MKKTILFALFFILLNSCNQNYITVDTANGGCFVYKQLNSEKYLESYFDTNKSKRYDIIFNSDSLKNGLCVFYYSNGQVESIVNFENGNENGTFVSYYSNGKTKEVVDFKKGSQDGRLIDFYNNGKIHSFQNFNFGKKEGEFVFYDSLGHILSKKYYFEDEQIYSERWSLINNSNLLIESKCHKFICLEPKIRLMKNTKVGYPIILNLEKYDTAKYSICLKLNNFDSLTLFNSSQETYTFNGNIINLEILPVKKGRHDIKGEVFINSRGNNKIVIKFPFVCSYTIY